MSNKYMTAMRRPVSMAVALVMLFAVSVPTALLGKVSAGQATSRSVTMSSSTPSATGVTYTVSFKATSAATLGGIIVDFCADTPLVGTNTCTQPAGLTLGTSGTITADTITGIGGTWTPAGIQGGAAASNYQAVKYTNPTPAAPTSFSATPLVLTLTGVTNPSTTGSFYARIITFNTNTNANTYGTTAGSTTTRDTTLTGLVDSGGAAMSTASAIALTARVMETLSFCVYTSTCGDTTAVELGTGTAGTKTIDNLSVYTGNLNFSLSTNALTGATVVLKATGPNNGLPTSGSNFIAAAGGGTASGAIVAGTAGFGVKIGTTSATTGTINRDADYSTSTDYGFITSETGSASGSAFANSNSLPVNTGVAPFTYGITASTTTPAGIYTATHQLIATGTF